MASNHTQHFGLCQWEATDPVLREEFNQDNAKIDAALAACGNCQIVTGSYEGNGHYNTTGASTLAFHGRPIAVFINSCGNTSYLFAFAGNPWGQALTNGAGWTVSLIWSENQLSWYSQSSADEQMNTKGTTYHYFALLDTVKQPE